jgi:hypothetical protein
MERVDTTSQQGQQQNQANPSSQTDTSGYNANPTNANPSASQDTSAMSGQDTSGMSGMDSTGMRHDSTGANSGAANLDSTGMSKTGDTTGYQQTKQPQDTTTSR